MIYTAVREGWRALLPRDSAAPAVVPLPAAPRLLSLDLKSFSGLSHPASAPHHVPPGLLQGHSCARVRGSHWGSCLILQHPRAQRDPVLLGPRTLQPEQGAEPCSVAPRQECNSQTPLRGCLGSQPKLWPQWLPSSSGWVFARGSNTTTAALSRHGGSCRCWRVTAPTLSQGQGHSPEPRGIAQPAAVVSSCPSGRSVNTPAPGAPSRNWDSHPLRTTSDMSLDPPQPKSLSWAQLDFYVSRTGETAPGSSGMLTVMCLGFRQAQTSARRGQSPGAAPGPQQPRGPRASPGPEPSGSRKAAAAEARTDSAILCCLPEGMPGPAGPRRVPSPTGAGPAPRSGRCPAAGRLEAAVGAAGWVHRTPRRHRAMGVWHRGPRAEGSDGEVTASLEWGENPNKSPVLFFHHRQVCYPPPTSTPAAPHLHRGARVRWKQA